MTETSETKQITKRIPTSWFRIILLNGIVPRWNIMMTKIALGTRIPTVGTADSKFDPTTSFIFPHDFFSWRIAGKLESEKTERKEENIHERTRRKQNDKQSQKFLTKEVRSKWTGALFTENHQSPRFHRSRPSFESAARRLRRSDFIRTLLR